MLSLTLVLSVYCVFLCMSWICSFGSTWNFFALLNSRLEDHQGFEKWHNGCGSFHSSACIDETAVIEIGAIVHPRAVIGPNTYIGSGAIIGPAVSIGQSTKLGYYVVYLATIVLLTM